MNTTAREIIVLNDLTGASDEPKESAVDSEMSFDPQDLSGESDYTVAQTAKLLGKSTRQIQRLLTRGILRGYKVNGPNGLEWRVRNELGAVNARDSLESRFQHLSKSIEALSQEIARLQDELKTSTLRERDLEAAVLLLVSDDKSIRGDIEILREAITKIAVIAKEQQNTWFNRIFSKV